MGKSVKVDEKAVEAGYQDVRDDSSPTIFMMLTYQDDNAKIGVHKSGAEYSEVVTELSSADASTMRAYVYFRVTTGDEISKRTKFVLLTWCGPGVTVIKKARMSLEKTEVKKIVTNYAVEVQTSDTEDVLIDNIIEKVRKSGGANYGTGKA